MSHCSNGIKIKSNYQLMSFSWALHIPKNLMLETLYFSNMVECEMRGKLFWMSIDQGGSFFPCHDNHLSSLKRQKEIRNESMPPHFAHNTIYWCVGGARNHNRFSSHPLDGVWMPFIRNICKGTKRVGLSNWCTVWNKRTGLTILKNGTCTLIRDKECNFDSIISSYNY